MIKKLPATAKDLLMLNLLLKIIYHSTVFFHKVRGSWKYPARVSGDLENMTIHDKIYWLYKTENPMRRPPRHSGFGPFFQAQANNMPRLPDGFKTESELSLSAAGDLMTHDYLVNSDDHLYNEVADILFKKDICMANLECCISAEKKENLEFSKKNTPAIFHSVNSFRVVKGFKDRNFDFVATACNHSLDLGTDGVASTAAFLFKEGIRFNGINLAAEDAQKATIIEKNNCRIGIICYTFGLNGCKPPADQPYLVNRLNLNDPPAKIDFSQVEKQIFFCRENNVDFIIAQLHWGYEHEFYPRPEQQAVAHHLAELGVDAIIGHHPHVVQPAEYYNTQRDSQRVVPIFYSLGNLVNPFSAPYLCTSYIAALTLAKGKTADGATRTYISNASLAEVVQIADTVTQTIRLQPAPSR